MSWRILVADLAGACRVALEPQSTPFRTWSRLLAAQAHAPVLPECGEPLIPGVQFNPDRDTFATAGQLLVELPTALTSALLAEVPAAFHAAH